MVGNLRAWNQWTDAPKEMPSGLWLSALGSGQPLWPPEPLFLLWLVLWAFVEGITPDLQPLGWLLSSANGRGGRRWDRLRRGVALALISDGGRRVIVTGGNPACFTILLGSRWPCPHISKNSLLLESSLTLHFQCAVCVLLGAD